MRCCVEALLFYTPYGVWVALSSRSGVDVHSIVEVGQDFTVTDMNEIRDKKLMYMTMMMDRYDSRRLLVSGVAMRWARSSGPPSAGAPKFQAK